ncbi:hypothetical protein ACFHW2_37345 [Actinomadura sp. LOL_016]|uniref:hypothetical protein n=1 Tax=unclassified Actinomadura TaxID=2626254 RepID=UPI003A812D1E
MRAAQTLDHLTTQIRKAFDGDVADAILADTDLIESAARLCKDATADDVTATVREIASDVNDGLADWLVETASAPGGWFLAQLCDRL